MDTFLSSISRVKDSLKQFKIEYNNNSLIKTKIQSTTNDDGTKNAVIAAKKNQAAAAAVASEEIKINDNETSITDENKFDIVCQELDNALQREKKAEMLLQKQTQKFEELTNKLSSELKSADSMERIINELNMILNKRDEFIGQLQMRISDLQSAKDTYESSASSILLDKELFLNYCKKIESLINRSLVRSMKRSPINYNEIISIIKHISDISIANSTKSSNNSNENNFKSNNSNNNNHQIKISPESIACQVNKINKFLSYLIKINL